MKKKFLSLMMAAAVVATTSVSAFATENKTYTIENEESEAQVTITGNVADSAGKLPPSTISVSVPTALAFTITKDGVVESAPITITSNSTEKVEVVASSFVDTTTNNNITVVPKNEVNSQENTATNRFVALTLRGNNGSVGLKSGKTATTTGLIKDDAGNEWATNENASLGFVTKNNDLTLRLSGTAGVGSSSSNYVPPTSAIDDQFTLTLKIKKAK